MSNTIFLQGTFFAEDLNDELEDGQPSEKTYAAAFRRLYYHLYSNSSASRAERIITDLSNLLLCKIAGERSGGAQALASFLSGEGGANELLIPVLRKTFPNVVGFDERFSLDDKALRHGLRELTPFTFSTAPAHILGEAFQALIGPRLRGDKGQFFTPSSLVRMIVGILNPPFEAKVVDPACGTGGFLVETHAVQQSGRQRDTSTAGPLIGIDKDHDLCRLSDAILAATAQDRAVILNRNSLDFAALMSLPPSVSPLNADFVVTNPPFGANIKINDRIILSQYKLGHKWLQTEQGWRMQNVVRDVQDPQILFLELCIRLLKPQGRMGIVLPEGVFGNTGLGYVWDFVRNEGTIEALVDCPRTTFQPSTDTKTNVLFFRKSGQTEDLDSNTGKTWAAIALHCGHDRRGRATNSLGEPFRDDFDRVRREYSQKESGSAFWQLIELNDPYYLVPRYYDTSPLAELQQEAQRLGTELMSLGTMVKKGFLRIRKGHEVGAEAYGTGDIPFVRTSDIANYEVSIDPTRAVSEEVYARYADQQQLAPGDILMVSDGRYRIGRTAILHHHNYICVVQSHLRIISVTPKCPISAIELLYLLNLPMVQHQVRNLVFIQSTLGSLGRRLFEICLPLPKQTHEWKIVIDEFSTLIAQRADLLRRLKEFEHPGYEL